MNKKIAFISELPFNGKVYRDNKNMRTEFAWMCALEAEHFNIFNINSCATSYDLGILIVPKKINFEALDKFWLNYRPIFKKIAIMQEGPNWYFQDYDIETQFKYYELLSKVDFILCHNEYDIRYYEGLTEKNVYTLQSLIITDNLFSEEQMGEKNESVMIGGNFVSWYGGFDSYIAAREMEIPIFAPSMGRKQHQEDWIKEINYLPYMNWQDWMHNLGKHKYGIHLMRTYAAGTFALNCAYWGIPCIGYGNLDTQRILHQPSLTIEEGDLKSARDTAYALVKDKEFYKECRRYAKSRYESFYTEAEFLKRFNNILESENI